MGWTLRFPGNFTFALLAIAGSLFLAAGDASADPPPAAIAPPASPGTALLPASGAPPSVPGADAGVQLPGGPLAEKPSLLKELPIAAYVVTAVTAAVGAGLYVFGGNAIDDLKDPAKHTTPDATHSLVVRARVGQAVSGVLFGFTGLATAWGTFSTVRAVMKISKFAKLPVTSVSAVPLPGGGAIGLQGEF